MDTCELKQVLQDLESDRVERKASISDNKKICQTVCAFANDLPNHQKPGVIFIGVNDDGSCANLTITDEMMLKLSQVREQVLPFPMMAVQKHTLNGCELIALTIEPADAPPVRYRGKVYVRVGPRVATASREEERRLSEKRRFKDLSFDLYPLSTATLDDIDQNLFQQVYVPSILSPDILAENERTLTCQGPLLQQLQSVRFATPDDPPKPTLLGILVAGNQPRQIIPGAYIQFVRYDGLEMLDPIVDSKEIDGPP